MNIMFGLVLAAIDCELLVLQRFQVRQARPDFSIGLKGDRHDN